MLLRSVLCIVFFARESARMTNTYDQICCSEVYFGLFFLQGKVLAWPTHMTHDVAPKCTLYCFFARDGGFFFGTLVGPRSPGGGGVYQEGTVINPSPKGKKGAGRGWELNHSRPKGQVGFLCPEPYFSHAGLSPGSFSLQGGLPNGGLPTPEGGPTIFGFA